MSQKPVALNITEPGHGGGAASCSPDEMGEAAAGSRKPIEVAVVGGGCASIAAAFELTQPRHKGAYHVTIYQLGWRLGGKGSSGRGVAGRIEEHELHVWLGCYDNAFLLLRQCYEELNGNAKEGVRNWDDLFLTDSHIAAAGPSAQGGWVNWAAHFPPAPGLPGDPIDEHNPFALKNYFGRAVALLRTLLLGMETFRASGDAGSVADGSLGGALDKSEAIVARVASLLRFGALASAAVAVEALALVEAALKSVPRVPENAVLKLLEAVAAAVREQFERIVSSDDHVRYEWEIIDLDPGKPGRRGSIWAADGSARSRCDQSSRSPGVAGNSTARPNAR